MVILKFREGMGSEAWGQVLFRAKLRGASFFILVFL